MLKERNLYANPSRRLSWISHATSRVSIKPMTHGPSIPSFNPTYSCIIFMWRQFENVIDESNALFVTFIFQGLITFFHRNEHEHNFKPFMAMNNYSVEICSYLKGTWRSMFLDMFSDSLTKYTNFVHPCPFSVSWCPELTKRTYLCVPQIKKNPLFYRVNCILTTSW